MVCAKNYETVSTFVEVMQKKPWPLFCGHGVVSSKPSHHLERLTVSGDTVIAGDDMADVLFVKKFDQITSGRASPACS